MTKILVTGATGFLGKALCISLLKSGYGVRATYRTSYPTEPEFQNIEWVKIPDLLPTEIWDKSLENCDVVIHSAARVHKMKLSKKDEEEFNNDNIMGTEAIVEAVLRNKEIKQFLFISTLLVYGKSQKMPLNQNKECFPDTLYGKSKLAAEELIKLKFKNSQKTWTIFRPAVMYGNNNKGNIASLEKFIRKGIPLPVKNIKNKRSFLSIENMCNFVISSILDKNSQNKIYCVADPEAISTEKLVLILGKSLHLNPKFIWVPFFILYILAILCDVIKKFGISLPWGRDALEKMFGNYWIDMTDSIKELKASKVVS